LKNLLFTILIGSIGWFIATALIRKYLEYRRRSVSVREWQEYKTRLPSWVKRIESLVTATLWVALFLACMSALLAIHSTLRSSERPVGPAVGIIVFCCLIGTVVPAMLLSNVISWACAPLRRANLTAMDGLETASFRSAQVGLLKLGTLVGVICAGVAALAVYEPWAIDSG
jgi:H+/gluconate symporter-like permease